MAEGLVDDLNELRTLPVSVRSVMYQFNLSISYGIEYRLKNKERRIQGKSTLPRFTYL